MDAALTEALRPALRVGLGLSFYEKMLAAAGSGAAIYDPSDLTSLYQSRTGGSTGAADSVVGIMLDKARMGNQTAAAFIAGQTELANNGGFDADTNWTKHANATISGGKLNVVGAVASGSPVATNDAATISPRWYQMTYTIESITGTVSLNVGGTTGTARSAPGTYTEILYAAAGSTFAIQSRGTGVTAAVIDNVSVKYIPGYHALAPSDAARPILRSASGLYYLDADGVDDRMTIAPTLNLGSQWWGVGGWQSDASGDAPFGLTNQEQSALSASGKWTWYDTSTTQADLVSATITSPHVLTVEQASASALSARVNGVDGLTINPYDGSSPTNGLGLFSRENDAFAVGLDGRFYGGVWNTGAITAANRAIIERWVASKTGVAL